jgi:hypothetical protein
LLAAAEFHLIAAEAGDEVAILQRVLTAAVARQQAFFQTVKWSARDRCG